MKNSVILLISCLLFITINNGCHKDPDIIDVNISISVKPEVVAYNGSAVISWTVSDGSYTRVETFGPYELTDKMTIDNIRENKTYTLYVYNKNNKVIKYQNFEVKSGDWTTSDFGLMSHNFWLFKLFVIKHKYTNGKWLSYTQEEMLKSDLYNSKHYFLTNGTYEVYLADGKQVGGYKDWKVENKVLSFYGADDQKIIKLDKDSLILELKTELLEDLDGDGLIDQPTSEAWVRHCFVRSK